MKKSPSPLLIPDEIVINKIYLIRGLKVMIDRDLGDLFNVETKRLKESVRRNISRFPDDFMFQMSVNEFKNWRTQFASSNTDKIGLRYAPFCFTEHGVVMLASILNSDRAIQMNIQIVRIFNRLREMLLTHKDILLKLETLEKQVIKNNTDKRGVLSSVLLRQLLLRQPTADRGPRTGSCASPTADCGPWTEDRFPKTFLNLPFSYLCHHHFWYILLSSSPLINF